MIRILSFIAVALAANSGMCEVLNLTGQITSGAIFVPAEAGNLNSYFLVSNFPIDYTAKVSIDSVGQVAGFSFTAAYAGTPLEFVDPSNLFPGVLQNDSTKLLIDFTSAPVGFQTILDLSVDKLAGTGEWEYGRFCPVCDGVYTSFHVVQATITSLNVVPEPRHGLLVIAIAGGAFMRRRSQTLS